MYLRKVVALPKDQATFIKARIATVVGTVQRYLLHNQTLALRLLTLAEVLHNSCNMGTHDFPEMYAQSFILQL